MNLGEEIRNKEIKEEIKSIGCESVNKYWLHEIMILIFWEL